MNFYHLDKLHLYSKFSPALAIGTLKMDQIL
jgi:hypothetical protein